MAKTTTTAAQAVRASSTPQPGVAPDAAPVAPAPADPPAVKAQSTSPRAKKAAAAKPEAAAKPATKTAATKSGAKAAASKSAGTKGKAAAKETGRFEHKPKGPDLREDLRAFVQAQPSGWGHQDWVTFLDHLTERGHDTSDPDAIGLLLERERLAAILEGVQGMGPRRVQAVVERYDTAWSAHGADVDELSTIAGMNRSLAEKVRQALHA